MDINNTTFNVESGSDNKFTGIDMSFLSNRDIKVDMSQLLLDAVMNERKNYYRLFKGHYLEIITNLRKFINTPKSFNQSCADFYLRFQQNIAVGKDAKGNFSIYGYVNNDYTATNPSAPWSMNSITTDSITWLLPLSLRPKGVKKEISQFNVYENDDNATFVVLRNKPVTMMSDYELICYYANRLAELQASRYSLIINAKVSKIAQVDSNNESMNQLLANFYSGAPVIKVNNAFSPQDDILDIGDNDLADKLKTLKQAFNDEINELNNGLGINSTGIDKASGVSDSEVASNDDVVTSTSNIYLNGIQAGLDLYNEKFGTDYGVEMNQPNIKNIIGNDSEKNIDTDTDGDDSNAEDND